MSDNRKTQMDIKDIPSEYFPIWGKTLDYERGLPRFRQPLEFSEEGVLIPVGDEYTYQQILRRVTPMPTSSQSSPTEQIELALSPTQKKHEMGDRNSSVPWQYTPWILTHGQVCGQPSGEGGSCDENIPSNPHQHHDVIYEDRYLSLMHEDLVKHLSVGEVPGQTYLQATFPPRIETLIGSTSTHRDSVQWDSRVQACPYSQYSLGHNGSMVSVQPDAQVADWSGLALCITSSYNPDVGADIWCNRKSVFDT